MTDIIGWDLIYKISEKELKKKEDVLTLLVHFLLIKAGYKCIGVGENQTITGNETSCETLPPGWNSSNNLSIRYVINNILYILRSVLVNNNVVFNLLRVDNLAVTNVALNINDTVETPHGTLDVIFKNKADEIVNKIRAELLNIEPGKEASSQTSTANTSKINQRDSSTNASPPLRAPSASEVRPSPLWVDPETDPSRVGRSDLDPFGRGGGMIFNPFGNRGGIPDPGAGFPGGLPRGAVPPGARFDPFGPFGIGQPRPRFPPPDPDNDPYGYFM